MRQVQIIVCFAAASWLAAPALSQADPVDRAYEDFKAGRYGPAFERLFDYRVAHDGTLRVDFMLAVSGCRLSDSKKALGGFLLDAIPNWYSPLNQNNLAAVRRQAQSCPPTGISEEDAVGAVARTSGKYDGNELDALDGDRSNSDNDEGLPRAPVIVGPPPSMGSRRMSPLVQGEAYLQADYNDVSVASASECSERCGNEARCVAMTFVVSQKRCWLKDKVPNTAASPDMISARKLGK